MTHRTEPVAYCRHCTALTPHAWIAQYGYMGEVKAPKETCGQCGKTADKPADHEEPAGDPPRLIIRGGEAARWRYARWRKEQGLITDELRTLD